MFHFTVPFRFVLLLLLFSCSLGTFSSLSRSSFTLSIFFCILDSNEYIYFYFVSWGYSFIKNNMNVQNNIKTAMNSFAKKLLQKKAHSLILQKNMQHKQK